MIRKLFLFLFFSATAVSVYAQQYEVKGTVTDASTKEKLIGASVTYASGKGTVTDVDGNYMLKLDTREN